MIPFKTFAGAQSQEECMRTVSEEDRPETRKHGEAAVSRRDFIKLSAKSLMGFTVLSLVGCASTDREREDDELWSSPLDFGPYSLEEVPPPLVNGWYEISTQGHLLYMGKTWGKGALPRDGKYRLVNDINMQGVQGFQAIGTKKENNFKGEFDGNHRIVFNLDVNMPGKKYVGFFGYIGEETENSHVYDLGLVNIRVTGTQNVGAIVGVSYGFIENCFAIGSVYGDDGSNGNAIAGFAGKNKGGEEKVIGRFYNCYFFGEVSAESYSVGGMIGKEEGGEVLNSWAYGPLTARDVNGSVGGMAGSFNAGNSFKTSVTMATVITGYRNIDKICGQLDDETGEQVIGNLAWEGTRLVGNEPAEQTFKWTDKSAADLQKRQTYEYLGWDFDRTWSWYGSSRHGFPVLRSFNEQAQVDHINLDFTIAEPVINSIPVHEARAGENIPISVNLVLPQGIAASEMDVFYEYGPRNDEAGFSLDGKGFTRKISLTKRETVLPGSSRPPLRNMCITMSKEEPITAWCLPSPTTYPKPSASPWTTAALTGSPITLCWGLAKPPRSVR
jgi:hypothetical protein